MLVLVAEVGKIVDLTHACAKNGGIRDGVVSLRRPLAGVGLEDASFVDWLSIRKLGVRMGSLFGLIILKLETAKALLDRELPRKQYSLESTSPFPKALHLTPNLHAE